MSVSDLCDEQEAWALKMLRNAGVLAECRSHEGVFVEQGSDAESAYRYGTTVFNNDMDKCLFDDLTQARDSIKQAYDEHGGNDICPLCSKYADD